jgi:SAM-dependent methyltransferase
MLVPDGFDDLMDLDNGHNREVGGLLPRRVAPPSELPSPWVQRFAPLIPTGGRVLDLACGMGRHARFLAERGHQVDAVDRDAAALECLRAVDGVHGVCVDLEANVWPFSGRSWLGIVAANYLHRPLFPALIASLAPGGVLIYETFMVGNERFGRPSTPAFLLGPGELMNLCGDGLSVIAFEQGEVSRPRPAVVQRICAVRADDPSRITLPECVAPES